MIDITLNQIFNAKMSDSEFDKLSTFIFDQAGIKMPKVKKVMLQSRLQKRLRKLEITSFDAYIEYLFSEKGQKEEIIHMLDVVSTNKTDFFREPVHFDFLKDQVLPEFIKKQNLDNIKIWSAGCSSGEEPYTVAMVLEEFSNEINSINYSLTGTDISSQILQKAALAVYKEERITNIPLEIKRKYFLRSKDRNKKTVRIIKKLRDKVKYKRLNFMADVYNLNKEFDVIFCRNVLIYFNRETQEKVINKLCLKLKRNGYLFIGHSESIMGMDVPLKQIKPTIFKRI
ncbi:MAG: hypothetical protein MI739_11755 [Bacteroidales bacterium]|nr:hypothetical protein [Bacteroidales bacterium]